MKTRKQTTLTIVEVPAKNASIIRAPRAPAWKGNEREDLLCGGCGIVLAEGISVATVKNKLVAPAQMLLTCPRCHRHNRIPVEVGH